MFGLNPLFAGANVAAISWIDWMIVVFYLCGVVGVGLWAGLTRKSAEGADYFLADKSLTWPVIGLALFSTNISTIHLVSLAESGYQTGLAMGNFEWMAAFTLICLSLFFAPFYLRSKVATLPDFLEKRYCRPCRDWLAAISILSAIIVHLGFTLFTGAYVLEGFLLNELVANPENYRLVTLCVIGGLAGLYTIVGGLKAVVLTESLDTIVLLFGAICITAFGYYHVGGWDGIETAIAEMTDQVAASKAAGESFGNIPEHVGQHLSIIRPHGDQSADLPWYAVLLGYPVIGIWYWCTDQTIVQRVLGAKDENHARVGPLFAGFIKILPVFIFILPGTMCLALIHQGYLDPLPLKDGVPNTRAALPHLIMGLLPVGLKGIMAAALLAALMSTVSGALNSIATLFSFDLFKRWRPETSDKKLILIGRIVTVLALAAAILWSLRLDRYESIFQGIVQVISYIAPPISALFLWGVFIRRVTSRAALITAWFGTALGITTFLLEWFGCFKIWEASLGFHTPWLMIAVYLFVACSVVLLVTSYSLKAMKCLVGVGLALLLLGNLTYWGGGLEWLTGPDGVARLKDAEGMAPFWMGWVAVTAFTLAVGSALLTIVMILTPEQPESPEKDQLVWKSPLEPLRGEAWRGIGNFRLLTVVLIVTIVTFYWMFS